MNNVMEQNIQLENRTKYTYQVDDIRKVGML